MSHVLVGLITIFAIVLVPVYVFIIATILGRPRAPRLAALILSIPAALAVAAVAFTWILSAVMSIIVP